MISPTRNETTKLAGRVSCILISAFLSIRSVILRFSPVGDDIMKVATSIASKLVSAVLPGPNRRLTLFPLLHEFANISVVALGDHLGLVLPGLYL